MNRVRDSDPEPTEDGMITYAGQLHRQKATFSHWRPSFREVVAIILGRPIRIGVFGADLISIDTEE